MAQVYAGADNIISSLGFNAEENYQNILKGCCGIKIDESTRYSPSAVPLSLVDKVKLSERIIKDQEQFTTLEKMFVLSIDDVIHQSRIDISAPDCLFLFTSTKGNIALLNPGINKNISRKRIGLLEMAVKVNNHFGNANKPVVVSNACVSGVVGLIYASRLIRSGRYRNIIVSGGDLVSEFIVSGFQSFQSLSTTACRPFDKNRDGLTLGEGVGSILLSADTGVFLDEKPIGVLHGASSNDANHISGPSRTGEGLQIAVKHALALSGMSPSEIDTISAHGTATDYNDEMEAKAFSSAGLDAVPLNSYKGYIGHTLGAAGIIETAIALQSMKNDTMIRSAGYDTHGVTTNINIIKETKRQTIRTCLKTASGFGGSNAALVFQKQY